MSSIAPVANFDGSVRRVGFVAGDTGENWNNTLLNREDKNNPLFVGMGNALKIFMSYQITPPDPVVDPFKVWVNLCWLQRAKPPRAFTASTTSRDRDEIVRGFDYEEEIGTEADFVNNIDTCNRGIFYDFTHEKEDSVISPSGSGEFIDIVPKFQRISLHTISDIDTETPFPYTTLGLDPSFYFIDTPGYQYRYGLGFSYECIAKADELFFVLTCVPTTFQGSEGDYVSIDVGIGANAQGEQI
ncbi:MAG: hypothetical protein ACYS7Y_16060 [Planctomycetota bacterium]|jgi:hypothetical protein